MPIVDEILETGLFYEYNDGYIVQDGFIYEGMIVELDASAFDPDGDDNSLEYTWDAAGGASISILGHCDDLAGNIDSVPCETNADCQNCSDSQFSTENECLFNEDGSATGNIWGGGCLDDNSGQLAYLQLPIHIEEDTEFTVELEVEDTDGNESNTLFIHITGDVPEFSKLTELNRNEWDGLVNKFINRPAQVSQNAMESFVPGGSDDPRLFKDAYGRIVIVGPALPAGKKVGGHARAKAEVFRGALRPFATTVNQELSDVLKSNVRMFVILPGTVDGKEPSDENLIDTINYLVTKEAGSSSEVIFCPDESR